MLRVKSQQQLTWTGYRIMDGQAQCTDIAWCYMATVHGTTFFSCHYL